jgi:hypothetical protein
MCAREERRNDASGRGTERINEVAFGSLVAAEIVISYCNRVDYISE